MRSDATNNWETKRTIRLAETRRPIPTDKQSAHAYLLAQHFIDRAARKFPWYDGPWLRAYWAAKQVVARISPGRLDRFVEAFAPLRTRTDFVVQELSAPFDADRLAAIRRLVAEMPSAVLETKELDVFGRTVVHDLPAFGILQRDIESLVSDLVGEPVATSYNFLSLYTQAGACPPHIDAPWAKWTLDLCIDRSRPWPLHVSQVVDWPEDFPIVGTEWGSFIRNDPSLRFRAYAPAPGDAILFSGSSQWHFRERLPAASPGDFCTLLFFHFYPRGMAEILKPANWPALFGIEELGWVVPAKSTRDARGRARPARAVSNTAKG